MNAPTASTAPSASPRVRTSSSPQVDLPALRARAGNDEELLREVLGDFLRDVGSLRGAVEVSIDDGRFGDAGRAAHRIRGALLALGADRAALAASALEDGAGALVAVTEPTEAQRDQVSAQLVTFATCLADACAEMKRYLGDESPI